MEASGGIFGSTQTSAGTLQNHKVRDKLELMLELGVGVRIMVGLR